MVNVVSVLIKKWSHGCFKGRRAPKRLWGLGLLLCVILPFGEAFAVHIEVSLDRNPVPINESFTVTFAADEAPDDDPDLSPLRDNFEIVNQSQSNQFSMVNGKTTRQVRWQVELIAKTPGALEIPIIAFGKDKSRPFMVTVIQGAVSNRSGADANLFLEMEAAPNNPYVQAQVILTVRVLSRVAFSGDLAQPEVQGVVIDKLDDDRQYMALRDGIQFRVDERRYTLYPEKSGRLSIPPVTMTAELGGQNLGPLSRSKGRQQRFHSDPLTLDVRPIPGSFTGSSWLPAARLELLEQWTPKDLKVQAGEPLTRTLTLTAEGASVGLLPELTGPDILGGEVKQYPDQPVTKEEKARSGLVSQRQQKTALLAVKPGSYKVPAVEIPWWNTVKDQMEIVKVPAHEVTVLPAADGGGAKTAPPPMAQIPEAPVTKEPLLPAPLDPQQKDQSPGFWPWVSLGLGLGWAGTLMIWWGRSENPRTIEPSAQEAFHAPRAGSQLKRLEAACLQGDPLAARRALEAWAQDQWPSLSSAARLQALETDLGETWQDLNRHLYGHGEKGWDGQALLRKVQSTVATLASTAGGKAKSKDVLESLHKL